MFLSESDIVKAIDEIVDGMNPDNVESLIDESGLTFGQVMGRITNELKARLAL